MSDENATISAIVKDLHVVYAQHKADIPHEIVQHMVVSQWSLKELMALNVSLLSKCDIKEGFIVAHRLHELICGRIRYDTVAQPFLLAGLGLDLAEDGSKEALCLLQLAISNEMGEDWTDEKEEQLSSLN